MWWAYLLVFFGGSLMGTIVMGLMAASKTDEEIRNVMKAYHDRGREPHEVHVYCDEDGNMEIFTVPSDDKIIWHKKEEWVDIEKRIRNYEETLEMLKDMNLHA